MTSLRESLNTQPRTTLAMVGPVADGKSTCVDRLTGIKTATHSLEKKLNGKTIKQGFANMKIWEDTNGKLYSTDSSPNEFKTENENCTIVNHISFADLPGHHSLMKTMLGSLSMIDGAILVVAVDSSLESKPQLIQQLAALKLACIHKVIVCMNKIDLVPQDVLFSRKEELDQLFKKYEIVPLVVIPTCFNQGIGIDKLIFAIMKFFNPSDYIQNQKESDPLFVISRTFDVNKPGTPYDQIIGGVFGGSLLSGTIKRGDDVEIRPGLVVKNKEGKFECIPLKTNVKSIESQRKDLESIDYKGLVSIGTYIDPFYFKGDGEGKGKDSLVGHVVGIPGQMPSVFIQFCFELKLVTTFGISWKPVKKDIIIIQAGTRVCDAMIKEIKNTMITIELAKPCCIIDNEHIIVCKNIDKILRIVGEGVIKYSENPNKLIE